MRQAAFRVTQSAYGSNEFLKVLLSTLESAKQAVGI